MIPDYIPKINSNFEKQIMIPNEEKEKKGVILQKKIICLITMNNFKTQE